MQVKKDELRLKLIEKAEKEFLEKGFLGASLRKIVKDAGTSIGNFYNYFQNKEELFKAVVEEEYINFVSFITNHKKLESFNYLDEFSNTTDLVKFFPLILDELLPNISDSFVVLVEGSNGTAFESVREDIISLLNEHIREHIKPCLQGYLYSELTMLISEQLLDGIVLIIKKYKDKDIRRRLLTAHIMFYFNGFVGLIGSNN